MLVWGGRGVGVLGQGEDNLIMVADKSAHSDWLVVCVYLYM